jgi:hypothetical protein
VTPRMDHGDFLRAVRGLFEAYAILSRSILAALPPQLGAIAAVDPLTRVALEQFGDPLVRWFGRGSSLRGVHVADGTLVFGGPDATAVRFLPAVAAEHDSELPRDWQEQGRIVGRIGDGELVLL